MVRPTRRSARSQGAGSSPQPPTTRKHAVAKTEPNESPEPRRKQPRASAVAKTEPNESPEPRRKQPRASQGGAAAEGSNRRSSSRCGDGGGGGGGDGGSSGGGGGDGDGDCDGGGSGRGVNSGGRGGRYGGGGGGGDGGGGSGSGISNGAGGDGGGSSDSGEGGSSSGGGRNSGSGGGGGGSSAGGGGGAGSELGSGRRRSAGFLDMGSQNADGEPEESFEFSESQGAARAKMAKAAAKQSEELLLEDKDEKRAEDISAEERAVLVKAMMRFLVMKGLSHEPATRKEMMDTVLGSSYRGKRVLMYVLKKAAHLLETAVGFRVKTAQKDKPYYVKDAYYVINALNHNQHTAEVLKGRGQAARGLLTMVLCVICCSADKDKIVPEDDLFKKLHNHLDSRIPAKACSQSDRSGTKTKTQAFVPGLGDIHELLATFVKQHFLMKKVATKPTADGGTENVTAYTMGARAAIEVGNMQLVTLMAETMGNSVDPSSLVGMDDDAGSGLSQAAT